MEDFAAMRLIAKQAIKKEFRQSWQFRFEIPQAPDDFDFYVKDVSYGPIEVETEPEKIGPSALTITYPIASAPVQLSMTMRDHEDGRIHNWFAGLVSKVLLEDGTIALPPEYCLNVERYTVLQTGSGTGGVLTDTWVMYPTQLGDVTESRDEPGFCEFPITFIQFRSL